jgi:hypothetical protein
MAFVASVASRKPAPRPGWAISASARLDAYRFQASGPHAFAVRCSTARRHVPEPLTEFTRPAGPIPRTMPPRPPQLLPQRSVTMANAPPRGQDGLIHTCDLGFWKSEILPDGLICRIPSGLRALNRLIRAK